MINSGKIFAFVLVFFVFMSGVSALSVYGQFDNGQSIKTINDGQYANYNVAAIADQDTQWLKVTGKLYRVVNNDVVLVKTLFSETVYDGYYYPSTKSVVKADYQNSGSYFIDVLAEQKWNDGTTSARATQLYLNVSSLIQNNPPVILSIPDQEILETVNSYRYNLQVSDPDADPLTCYKVVGPDWLLVNATGCFVYATTIPQVNQNTSYSVVVGVSDGRLSDQEDYVLKVVDVLQNMPPVADFVFAPQNPNAGQNVLFNASGSFDSDGDIVSYVWDFNDSTSGSGVYVSKAFSSPGVYAVQLTVMDDDGASHSISKNVEVSVPNLIVDELFCNPDVVIGHQQHCSAHVVGNVSGVTMAFKLSQGNILLGQCETNNKGYCHITPIINLASGDYEVYVEATKSGYLSDLSRSLKTNFKVWEKRYDVRNLKVYQDAYLTENYTFYRSDSVYVSFEVYDLINNNSVLASQGLLNQVFLRVNNNFVLNFSKYGNSTQDEYKYYLDEIPLSDDFLGQGNVYAFVFNFSDNTAGQEDVVVTILNNPLIFNSPDRVLLQENSSIILDMRSYLVDVETPVDQILLNYSNEGSLLFEVLGDKIFRVNANGFSGNQSVVFTADDTDGSVVSKAILFSVEPVPPVFEGPVAVIDVPETTSMGSEVVLNASRSYDQDGGSIVSYSWIIMRGDETLQVFTSSSPVAKFWFNLQGQHQVKLIVTSSSNKTGTLTKGIYVGRNYVQTVVGEEDGLFIENIEVVGHDWGVVALDDAFAVRATINNQRKTMNNLRLTFAVPELGFVVKSDAFSLRKDETKDVQFFVELPFSKLEVPSGEYVAIIGVSDSDIIRNKYFPLLIE